MAILFTSNQPEDYSGNVALNTNVTHFDIAKVPHALYMPDHASYLQLVDFTESSTTVTWCHYHQYSEHDTFSDGKYIEIRDTDDNLLAGIEVLNGTYAPVSYADSTVVGSYSPGTVADTVDIDLTVTVDASNIVVSLYIDKALISTATGVNTSGSKGKPVSMDFVIEGVAKNNNLYFSEIIIAETDTRDLRLFLRPPVAAGFHTDFAGAVADLSDHNDETVMTAGANGDRMSNTIASITGVNIHCVALVSRTATDGTGPANLKQGFRISGVDYDSAAAIGQSASLAAARHYFEISPATGIDWTTAEISGAEPMQLAQT